MKKYLFLLLFAVALFGCSDDEKVIDLYQVSVDLAYPDGVTASDDAVSVKLINSHNSKEFVGEMQDGGSYLFTVEAGEYNVFATDCIVETSGNEADYNGSKQNVNVMGDQIITLDMVLAGKKGFVIKEIYYAGTHTAADRVGYWADGFVEIYNNSDKVLYADGLCISDVDGISSNAPSVWINEDGTTKFGGLPMLFQTWVIPGSGQENGVEPGKSIVVAIDGINHHAENPNSSVDLTTANWETYFELSGRDTDSPGVANLTLAYSTTSTMHDWMMASSGIGVVLFRFPNGYDAYVKDDSHFQEKPGASNGTKFLIVPEELVIDAVDCVKSEESKYKRITSILDAGYVFCNDGAWSGKSIRRKVKEITSEGRVIYQDTNNSKEDFIFGQDPTPGVQPTVVD